MAAIAAPLISGIGSLLGGIFGSSAAKNASNAIVQGDQNAQNQISQSEGQALQNYSPYLSGGSGATTMLSSLLGTNGSGLLTPWTQQFKAPTAAEAAQTPGYQFQLQQGENAIQNSAAANGGLLSGRTLADLNNYAQGLASTNYQNTFNNALTEYQSAYNSFLNNQNNSYNRLMGLSGEGLNAAGAAGNITMGAGGELANLDTAIGNAKAGGILGKTNSLMGAISGVGGALSNLPWGSWFPGSGGAPTAPTSNLPLSPLSSYAQMPLSMLV